jgi:hypothetical protein
MRILWVVVAGVASFIGALALVVINDLFSEEVRGRLERLPRWIIRLAVLRLPADLRAYWSEEWLAELSAIVDERDRLPITRLCGGTWFAIGVLVAALMISHEFRGRAPLDWIQPLPRPDVRVALNLARARALIEETRQAVSLELGRSERVVEHWAGVLAQTQEEIEKVDDALAGPLAQMRLLQKQLGEIWMRKQQLNADEARMLTLRHSLLEVSNQRASETVKLRSLSSELIRLQAQAGDGQLQRMARGQRIQPDPPRREGELERLGLRRAATPRTPQRQQQLKLSLSATAASLGALGSRSQQIQSELHSLQRQEQHRRREVTQLQDRERVLRAKLAPLQAEVRWLESERGRLQGVARRQRRNQAQESKQARKLRWAQMGLPHLDHDVESALQLASPSESDPTPGWAQQSSRRIRMAWWREGARLRALRQVNQSGLNSAIALDYALYETLKLTSREAGRRTLVATLITAWLGRMWWVHCRSR